MASKTKSVKFEIPKSFSVLLPFSHWHQRISVKVHIIQKRFIIGPGNVLFCRLVQALFSSEMLQAVAMNGFNLSTASVNFLSLPLLLLSVSLLPSHTDASKGQGTSHLVSITLKLPAG